jgi:nuclear protein localization family protein 4
LEILAQQVRLFCIMLLRLRSRDGLERIQVDANATVADLQQKIAEQLQVSVHDQVLSQNHALLISKTPQEFVDMRDPSKSLAQLGLANGSMVFLYYSGERNIAGELLIHICFFLATWQLLSRPCVR